MTIETKVTFEAALKTFVAGCQKVMNKYYAEMKNQYSDLDITEGKKYVKLISKYGMIDPVTNEKKYSSSSAYCFVNKENGDVLKVATWNTPAKGARGNIFSIDNGLTKMGISGPAYLR